jgi:hypothetical protein
MPVPAYTDLFNEAIDDLTATLQTITGLQVVNDPRNIVPPCCFIDAPSWVSWNYNIVKLTFPVKVLTLDLPPTLTPNGRCSTCARSSWPKTWP